MERLKNILSNFDWNSKMIFCKDIFVLKVFRGVVEILIILTPS